MFAELPLPALVSRRAVSLGPFKELYGMLLDASLAPCPSESSELARSASLAQPPRVAPHSPDREIYPTCTRCSRKNRPRRAGSAAQIYRFGSLQPSSKVRLHILTALSCNQIATWLNAQVYTTMRDYRGQCECSSWRLR